MSLETDEGLKRSPEKKKKGRFLTQPFSSKNCRQEKASTKLTDLFSKQRKHDKRCLGGKVGHK
jgi:hypothetical protein